MDDFTFELRVPHRGQPTAIWYTDARQFIERTVSGVDACIWHQSTPRDLADSSGYSPEIVGKAAEDDTYLAQIADLGVTHGWDTPIFSADYAGVERGKYQVEPIDELEAVSAYAGHDLSGWWLVQTPAELNSLLAMLEGENAPRVGQCGPIAAANALRRTVERVAE